MTLVYKDDFICDEYEQQLLKWFITEGNNWYDRNGRDMQSYGFNYKKGEVGLHKIDRIPIIFDELINGIKQVFPYNFNQMTVNKYDRGQGIDSHYDHTTLFGNQIVGVTLGSGCTMIFEKMGEDKEIISHYLKRKSLYVLQDELRYGWKHRIRKVMDDTVDDIKIKRDIRISLTFRICAE